MPRNRRRRWVGKKTVNDADTARTIRNRRKYRYR